MVAENKEKRKIAVEIKTFLGDSLITELGQYLSYRIALSQQQSDYDLYLAVSSDIYQTFLLKQIVPKVAITELLPASEFVVQPGTEMTAIRTQLGLSQQEFASLLGSE